MVLPEYGTLRVHLQVVHDQLDELLVPNLYEFNLHANHMHLLPTLLEFDHGWLVDVDEVVVRTEDEGCGGELVQTNLRHEGIGQLLVLLTLQVIETMTIQHLDLVLALLLQLVDLVQVAVDDGLNLSAFLLLEGLNHFHHCLYAP